MASFREDSEANPEKLVARPMALIARAMRSRIIALCLLLAATNAAAQFHTVVQFVFSPALPQPGETVSVFIRATDPVNGFVFCPETAKIITRVQINGQSIVLDLLSVAPAGGFIRPFCDGNTVQLGPLAAGIYTVTARTVFPNGNIGSTLLTSQLVVRALEPIAVPLWDASSLIACIICLAIVGMRFASRR